MVHVHPSRGGAPIGIVFQQLDIKPIETAGCADVERTFPNLLDRGDACQRQEKPKMIRKAGIVAGNGFAGFEVLGLKRLAIGGKNEFCLRLGSNGAGFQGRDRSRDRAGGRRQPSECCWFAGPPNIGLVRHAAAQTLDRCRLVSEGFKERERELLCVERLLCQSRNRFFNFNCVHSARPNVNATSDHIIVGCASSGLPLKGSTLISPSRLRVWAMS
ncbi:hypothetical protein SAMN05518801_13520 [Novosphingobium sp. CF614]|nr:hypothetical protein SAMN05518801_13520 [Novosphingobium sp. CF614]